MSRVGEKSRTGAPEATMASVGSLARIALPEVLKTIALRELSGCLEVQSGRRVRTIYFDRGFIVFTASNSEDDRLGRVLLDAGKITERELEIAADLMKGKRRIGEAIVEAGYLTQDELGRELLSQARKISTSLFALEEGMYRFTQKECPIPLELRLSLSLYRIQLEGIRLMKNGKLIGSALPPERSVLQLSKCPPFSFEEVRFLPIEVLVMEAAQKARPLDAILGRVGKGKGTILRAVYGLLTAGILEPAGPEPVPPLKVQEEIGTFLLSKMDEREAARAESPAPAPEKASPPKAKAQGGELKRLLREIKLRKMVEDEEGTISLLYEVVALAPENAKYEAMLAQALASHSVMKSKAERHFRRALSLDPQNAEVHYLLGRYYQSFDMKSRALAEFKTALTIDPALSQARSALVELLGHEVSIQDKLKRLFA